MKEASTSAASVKSIIRQRAADRMTRERAQKNLISPEQIWHGQIADKIASLQLPMVMGNFGDWVYQEKWLENFYQCGKHQIRRVCQSCGDVHEFANACSLKFCPLCQWKITKARQRKIEAWASFVKKPVHLVLTQKNFPILTQSKISKHKKNLAAFRRLKVMRPVSGGTVSVEVTNEGNGWHLHSHWLMDSGWLDPSKIAIAWGKKVGQEYAIVKLKAIDDRGYLSECAKYVCKGSEMATWPAEQIWEFMRACRSNRFFFPFGTMQTMKEQVAERLAFLKPETKGCECGSHDFRYFPPADPV